MTMKKPELNDRAREWCANRIEKWLNKKQPTVNVGTVERLGVELQDRLAEYEAGDPAALGLMLNRLWWMDVVLNPRRFAFGHNHRDDAISAFDSDTLRICRREADAIILRFGVSATIAGNDVTAVIREAGRSSKMQGKPNGRRGKIRSNERRLKEKG